MEFRVELKEDEKKVIVLISRGINTFNKLLEYTNMSRSHLYIILQTLLRLGIIEYKSLSPEGKKKEYYLTDLGRELLKSFEHEIIDKIKIEANEDEIKAKLDHVRTIIMFSDFSPETKKEVSKLIDRIIELIEKGRER